MTDRSPPEIAFITNGCDWLIGDWDAKRTKGAIAYFRQDIYAAVMGENNALRMRIAELEGMADAKSLYRHQNYIGTK